MYQKAKTYKGMVYNIGYQYGFIKADKFVAWFSLDNAYRGIKVLDMVTFNLYETFEGKQKAINIKKCYEPSFDAFRDAIETEFEK